MRLDSAANQLTVNNPYPLTNGQPGAAHYGFQGADSDFLMDRLLVFDPSRPFHVSIRSTH